MEFYSELPYEDFSYYNTPSTHDVGGSILTGILMFYLIILLVGLTVAVVNYIFRGIGMYNMAKREGMDYPWLAFVPFARTYLLGELGGTVHLKNKQIKNPGIWLIVLPFISSIVTGILYVVIWVVLGFGVFFSSYSGFSFGTVTGIIIVAVIVIVFFTVYNAAYSVLRILVNRQIYEKFTTPGMAVAHAVLGVLLPLYESICLFVMRNRPYNPGKGPDLGTPFMTTPPPAKPVPPMPPQMPVTHQTPEEAPISEIPNPEEPQNTAKPVDGEFKKVEEEIVTGEYRRVDEPPKPEHEQMTSSYTYGEGKEEPEREELKTDDGPSAEQ